MIGVININALEQLQKWYMKNCNGDWEHGCSINIKTIDNPGWMIKINIQDTSEEFKEFKTVDEDRSDSDWVYCKVENNIFEGACGSNNLEELISIFLNWTNI